MIEWLGRALRAQRHELPALAWSFLYFFLLLAAYYVLRPVRDEMAVQAGPERLAQLFTATFVAMLLLVPAWGWLCARLPRARLLPLVYAFFALNLAGFWLAFQGNPARGAPPALAIGFFVWTSVFNLFVVSVFWAFMVDVFRTEQAKRLFGFIGFGGTLGGITGAALTATLAERVGPTSLFLVSAILLELAVQCVRRLSRLKRGEAEARGEVEQLIGGGTLAGVSHVLKSPYLLGICLYMLLFTVGSTVLYFQQAELASRSFSDRAAQTAFFARLDLAVNVLTLLTQMFLTGRLIKSLGVTLTLALLPALSVAGFALLGAVPVLAVFVVFQVLRRAGEYAVARPAREVLYTVLSREDKYKAKHFIDTFVYRGGDQVGAWSMRGMAALGLGLAGTAFVAAPLAAAWLGIALWLGRRQATLAR